MGKRTGKRNYRLCFSVPPGPCRHDELCFYGLDHKWIVEPGEFTIMIGRSSRDIALRGKLTVTDP
jgi:hypothetical protein